jgi:hypothetical protein
MKKALVILLAFALVFGLVFAACSNGTTGGGGGGGGGGGEGGGGGGGGGGPTEKVVLFDMSNSDNGKVKHEIQGLSLGKLDITGDKRPIKPLVQAGEGDDHVTIEAVKGPDEQKVSLKLTAKATWGPGIDMLSDEFGFLAGDKITITGEVLDIGTGSNPRVQLNFKVGAESAQGTEQKEAGEFKIEVTLEDKHIADIKAGMNNGKPYPAIRIELRPGTQVVRIDNIVIEGERPSDIRKLDKPVIELTEDKKGIKWTEIEGAGGYKVLAEDLDAPVTTTAATATSANLYNFLDAGTYSITLVATGVTGSTSDSDPSDPVTFVREPDSFTPPAGMVVLGPMNGLSPAVTQGGWGIKAAAEEAGKLPKYLVVAVDEGGDGLGGTKVILQSSELPWVEKTVSGDWNYDGTWAAPKKVFIFELLAAYSDYAAVALTEGYINVGLRMGTANTKITGDRIISGAIVFADTAAATKLAAVCISANLVTGTENPGNFWFIDGEFGDIFD